jgi:hypothetical protein
VLTRQREPIRVDNLQLIRKKAFKTKNDFRSYVFTATRAFKCSCSGGGRSGCLLCSIGFLNTVFFSNLNKLATGKTENNSNNNRDSTVYTEKRSPRQNHEAIHLSETLFLQQQ